MSHRPLTLRLRQLARKLGFSRMGVAPSVSPTGVKRLDAWLEAGYAGEMDYFAKRRDAYEHPQHVLPGVRSIVVLSLPYARELPDASAVTTARVARYALAPDDYHDRIHARLKVMVRYLQRRAPDSHQRGVVDTAPLLEREFGQIAGLGWQGKNTLLLNREEGSYFFLAAVLTNLELEYDEPHAADHCGTCTACLDACPTDAFPAPYVLDATRCISYLTIESKRPFPEPLRQYVGDWLFGCDVCQEVCPWNKHTEPKPPRNSTRVSQGIQRIAPLDSTAVLDPAKLLMLDEAAFRARFHHTPFWRPKRRGILRNAAIVLGNSGSPAGAPALAHGLNDTEPLVRGACAWSLGKIRSPSARELLSARKKVEADDEVLREIERALGECARSIE